MQTGKNYRAWQVKASDFPVGGTAPQQLNFLLRYAVLAPSSHNSQPWTFKCNGSVIAVEIDSGRILPISDANHRQLIISIGCALKNLMLAADYFSIPILVTYFPQGDDSALIASIKCDTSRSVIKSDVTHLAPLIPQRRTNRNKYDPARMPNASFFDEIKKVMPAQDMRIDLVNDTQQRNEIADVVIQAGIEAMGSKGFRTELSQYLISNISSRETGMPGFTIGIPTPPSLLVPKLMKHVNFGKLNKRQDIKLLKDYTPVFGVIATKQDTPLMWIKTGEWFEEIALLAERKSLATGPLAAAIQIGDNYKKLQRFLDTDYRPQFFFRLGYPLKAALHSPRLPTEAVTQWYD